MTRMKMLDTAVHLRWHQSDRGNSGPCQAEQVSKDKVEFQRLWIDNFLQA
jgi:hypothetical protein